MLGLTLLGPPALSRDGVVIALPVRKSMAVLLLLALHAGPLPRGRVSGLLWSDLDESAARRNLRRELARLRESGAGDAIDASGDGLGLQPGVTIDVVAFDAALAEGRADDALGLWRGAPAEGFALGDADAFDEWLARERVRLNERRRRALHASAAAHEASGELQTALDRIEALLADDPLQEQHHRDAMRLLAATGRREAALARYERCRVLLRDELGLTPMAETEALATSLRTASGSAATHATASPGEPPAQPSQETPGRIGGPPMRLPDQLPFVGRDHEVAVLEAAWASGRPIVVEGDGGVGKTRLATDFAAAHGPYAMARCRAGDGDVPYASFARALRALMGPTPSLPELPEWIAAEVVRLVPELGAPPPPLRTDEERNRFFEACAHAWQALSADDFDAVVIDDWHLADAASRALFAFVARRRHEAGSGGARELIVLRPELDDEAREGLRAFVASTAAACLALQALSGEEVFELVRRLSGVGAPTRFAGRLARATGGNAFFLAETLRHLVESGLLSVGNDGAWQTPFDASTEDYREIPVPASVQEAVLTRARRLAPSSQRVLEAAALADEPFEPALLAPACALSELDTVLAIEAGVAAGLLQEHASGGFAFPHDLVQQALAGSLSDDRRRLVHRRLALGAEAAGAPPATIAAHHEESGQSARAVAHRLRAGDDAERLHALDEARLQWLRALADRPTPGQALAAHRRLVSLAYDRSDVAAASDEVLRLAVLLDGGGLRDDERFEAMVLQVRASMTAGGHQRALEILDDLPAATDDRQRSLAHRARGTVMANLGRSAESLLEARAALALPDLPDADRLELLDLVFVADHNAGRVEAATAGAEAAIAVARRLGDVRAVARGRYRLGLQLVQSGDLARAETELAAAIDAAERFGSTYMARVALYNLSCVHATRDEPAAMLAAVERAFAMQPPMEATPVRAMLYAASVDGHVAAGDLGAALAATRRALADALDQGDIGVRIHVATSLLGPLAWSGDAASARRLLATIDAASLGGLANAAAEFRVALAEFELATGDLDASARALDAYAAAGGSHETRVRVRAAHAEGALRLARGDARGALAVLPPADEPAGHASLRARGLALRIAAEAADGSSSASTQAMAASTLAALGDRCNLDALALLRVLKCSSGDAGSKVASMRDALVSTLHAEPAAQQRLGALLS